MPPKLCLRLFLGLVFLWQACAQIQDVEREDNMDKINDLEQEFDAVQNDLTELDERLDNKIRQCKNYDNKIFDSLVATHSSTENEIKRLDDIVKSLEKETISTIAAISIDYIVADQFETAYQKITEFASSLNSEQTNQLLSNITKGVYANKIGNFDLVHTFAETVQNVTLKCTVLNELWMKMAENGHKDALKLLRFYNTLSKLNANLTLIEKLPNVCDKNDDRVRKAFIASAMELIKVNVPVKSYWDIQNLKNLMKELYILTDKNISDEIIHEVFDDLYYNSIEGLQFIPVATSAFQIPQIIEFLSYSLRQLRASDSSIMLIGEHLKKLQSMPDYGKTELSRQQQAKDTINRLPSSIKNFYFADKVIFRNYYDDAYLNSFGLESDSFRVRAKIDYSKGMISGLWIVAKHPLDPYLFQFKNAANTTDYMVADSEYPTADFHQVMSTVFKKPMDEIHSWWRMIPSPSDTNLISIRDAYSNEILCTDYEFQTAYTSFNTESGKCLWKIEGYYKLT